MNIHEYGKAEHDPFIDDMRNVPLEASFFAAEMPTTKEREGSNLEVHTSSVQEGALAVSGVAQAAANRHGEDHSQRLQHAA